MVTAARASKKYIFLQIFSKVKKEPIENEKEDLL